VTADRINRASSWVLAASSGLLDLLLDVRCLGCRQPGVVWCVRCVHAAWSPHVHNERVGQPVVSAAPYAGGVRRAVVAHKERGQLGLAPPLGRLLAGAVACFPLTGRVRLVPCPSNTAVIRARGQDHARRLADQAARSLRNAGIDVTVVSPLTLTRSISDQVGLSVQQRQDNLRNTVVAQTPSTPGTAVIIVDDVTTSGSTLSEANRALLGAGWSVLGSAVVARAGPHMGVADAGSLG